jgi:hypothetical protein
MQTSNSKSSNLRRADNPLYTCKDSTRVLVVCPPINRLIVKTHNTKTSTIREEKINMTVDQWESKARVGR